MKVTIWTCKLLLICSLFVVDAAQGEEISVVKQLDARRIIDQHLYRDSPNACGPTALLNALKFGDQELQSIYQSLLGGRDDKRLRYVIDRYFRARPSSIAPSQKRSGIHGVYARDMALGCNELLAEYKLDTCQSDFLDRLDDESDAKHLERVHERMSRSIKNGFPPILSLRSFVVRRRTETKHEPRWEIAFQHFVVIHSVPEKLSEIATGFEATVLDSNGSRAGAIHIHPEANQQEFMALKGNDIRGRWMTGRPFLLVTAPGMTALRPANLSGSDRYIITANFLIGRY
ncbi:MAG: hypothetical protein P1U89_19775 [Verrucomicrobiales bacterium]|nr:hypothetical protein [Verrucomicrobiales bacterium]